MDKSDFDAIYDEAYKNEKITEENALSIAARKFQNSKGYYKWSPMGENEDAAWLIRIPRDDLPEEVWLKEEKVDFVHLCDPIKYLEAAKKRDKELAAKAAAYVRDKDNSLNTLKELRCSKCGKKASDLIYKKVQMFLFLHKLGSAQ